MILVDTSVWVNHLRRSNAELVRLLEAEKVLGHPFVLGELALGDFRQREAMSSLMPDLPGATAAEDAEVMILIQRSRLFASGIGYVDAHLLASTRLMAPARLWTQDRRLHAVAQRLSVAYEAEDGGHP